MSCTVQEFIGLIMSQGSGFTVIFRGVGTLAPNVQPGGGKDRIERAKRY